MRCTQLDRHCRYQVVCLRATALIGTSSAYGRAVVVIDRVHKVGMSAKRRPQLRHYYAQLSKVNSPVCTRLYFHLSNITDTTLSHPHRPVMRGYSSRVIKRQLLSDVKPPAVQMRARRAITQRLVIRGINVARNKGEFG